MFLDVVGNDRDNVGRDIHISLTIVTALESHARFFGPIANLDDARAWFHVRAVDGLESRRPKTDMVTEQKLDHLPTRVVVFGEIADDFLCPLGRDSVIVVARPRLLITRHVQVDSLSGDNLANLVVPRGTPFRLRPLEEHFERFELAVSRGTSTARVPTRGFMVGKLGESEYVGMSVDKTAGEAFRTEVEERLGITIRDGEVQLNDENSGATNLTEFVGYLVENGYIADADLPIESGWERYLVNDTPHHKEGKEMFRPRETASGFFVETNHNLVGIKRNIQQLAQMALEE